MGFELQGFDQDLVKAVSFEILVNPVSGFEVGGSGKIPFQFPPRIMEDTKSIRWEEENKRTYEPIAIFMGSDARKISIEATYIVTGGSVNNYKFDAFGVAAITKNIKAYGYPKSANTAPILRLNMYEQVEGGGATFRITDISFSHGETLISTGGAISFTFPLLTKVKIGAALFTKIGSPSGDKKQDVPTLPQTPIAGWY